MEFQDNQTVEKGDIKDLITKEEIISIDIRYTNSLGFWEEISIPSYNFSQSLLEKGLLINKRLLNISLQRSFLDCFTSHKTLVFLTDFFDISLEIANKEEKKDYILNFSLENNTIKEYKSGNNSYQRTISNNAKGIYDVFKDIRNEIVVSLATMGVNIKYHNYNLSENLQSVVMIGNGSLIKHLDDIQKVKYAILMITKAYNIEVSLNKGIFVDYKDIYNHLVSIKK